MENIMELDEVLKLSQELFAETNKLLGIDYQEKFESIKRLNNQMAKKNLETIQAAKSCANDAKKWKEIFENNPRKDLINEIEVEIEELNNQIKETQSNISRLQKEMTSLKIDSYEYPEEIISWHKNNIEIYYPKRIREIETERLKAIRELPGFGDAPKFAKSFDTIQAELATIEEENASLQKALDQMNANKNKISELKIENERIDMDILRIAERDSKFEEKENQLIREISELEIDIETLEKEMGKNSPNGSDEDVDDQDVDLNCLFKDPNDFPVLMNFLNKVHAKASNSPKSKMSNKNKPKLLRSLPIVSPDHSRKRKMSLDFSSRPSPSKRVTRSKSINISPKIVNEISVTQQSPRTKNGDNVSGSSTENIENNQSIAKSPSTKKISVPDSMEIPMDTDVCPQIVDIVADEAVPIEKVSEPTQINQNESLQPAENSVSNDASKTAPAIIIQKVEILPPVATQASNQINGESEKQNDQLMRTDSSINYLFNLSSNFETSSPMRNSGSNNDDIFNLSFGKDFEYEGGDGDGNINFNLSGDNGNAGGGEGMNFEFNFDGNAAASTPTSGTPNKGNDDFSVFF